MGTIKFDIRHPNGQRESALVEGERALVGSGSHCDVRLPVDQAAYEHVLLEVVGGTLRAEAKVDNPPATVNNMPLTACALDADSVLGLGRIRLFVSFVPDVLDGAGRAAGKKKGESNPAVQLGLVAVFGVAAYMLLGEGDSEITPPPEESPMLFSDKATECPKKHPTQAIAVADEHLALAGSLRERMPFRASDGVLAVKNYEVSAACYKLGKVEEAAREADEAAKTLKADIINDFRARRLRLSHMLEVEDFELAKRDVAVLRTLTEGSRSSYTEWLAATEKKLGGKVSGQ